MNHRKFVFATVLAGGALALGAVASPAGAFHEGGLVELSSHTFEWSAIDDGGVVLVTETVYEGCEGVDAAGAPFFNPHDMTFEYTVENISFEPEYTNGFSGFQIRFPQPVPELYNQQSPTPLWEQNAYSGQFPPFGVEWDIKLPNPGIIPGETGVFSYCTFERMDVVMPADPATSGWFHTWGLPAPEPIIDADGTVSPGDGVPGFVDVKVLDPLVPWPDSPPGQGAEGLDFFDNDGSCTYTSGDDFHVEGAIYPTARRDAFHDQNVDFQDPVVLDLDGSLFDGQQVDVDMETGSAFTGCAGPDPMLKYFDQNGMTFWDDGEDIVLDLNMDAIFGEVLNTQTYITYVENSVPGELLFALDLDACSDGHQICKKVKYLDDDRDGLIEVGEPVMFLEVIQVHNSSMYEWMDVTVEDRWGAEIGVQSADPTHGSVELTTKGKSEKVFLTWDIGDLAPGETANLVLHTMTDLDPGGYQTYTEAGEYEYNSGAVLKFLVHPDGARKPHQESFDTGSVLVTVTP